MIDTAKEHIDEKRYAQYRDCYVKGWEVRARDAGVEAPEGSNPDEKDNASLPGLQPIDAECGDWQTEEENDIENTPEREGNGLGKEEGEIFGPTFDHLRRGSVHARGDGFGCVAEADSAGWSFDVFGESDVLEDAIADSAMAADGEVGFAFDEEELAVGGGKAAGRIVDLLGRVDGGEF